MFFTDSMAKETRAPRDDMSWRRRYGVGVMNGRLHRDPQLPTYLSLNLFQDLY